MQWAFKIAILILLFSDSAYSQVQPGSSLRDESELDWSEDDDLNAGTGSSIERQAREERLENIPLPQAQVQPLPAPQDETSEQAAVVVPPPPVVIVDPRAQLRPERELESTPEPTADPNADVEVIFND